MKLTELIREVEMRVSERLQKADEEEAEDDFVQGRHYEKPHLNTEELESKIINLKFWLTDNKYQEGYNEALDDVLKLLDGRK